MLKLTKLTDYAVVILASIAKVQNDAIDEKAPLSSASSLASDTSLSEPTVSKILKLLAKAGVIESVRGVNGGYRLAVGTDEIAMIDVIEAIEGPVTMVSCVEGGQNQCPIEDQCQMRGTWDPVNTAIRTALENVSLKDMILFKSRAADSQENSRKTMVH